MPRPSPTPGSLMTTTVKENKPVWCSPGRPYSNLLRSGRGKPLGELKSGNRRPSLDGPCKAEKVLIPVAKKDPPVQKDSPSSTLSKTKVRQTPSQVSTVRVPSPVTSRPKTSKPPGTDETPPRSRPIKKPTALVTPTNKFRKPLVTAGGTPRGPIATKVCTPKGGTAKAITSSSRARSKNQANEETPVRKLRERTSSGESAGAQEIPKSGSRDNKAGQQQGVPGWAGGSAAGRGRKASPTHGRPPVKHLFLSPQVSKKTAKKDFLRKSIENHGIWVSSAAQRRRAALDKRNDVDSEMLPPAQPTNSPELPKRGSREASGEGIRGYFGAGPMVAPDGMGFVRDRRKCKPRGTLMVGQEGSMESDSSGVAESSVLMAPPSVASVEWMMNNDTNGNLEDFSSGSFHEPVTTSISEFTVRDDNQASDSFGEEQTRQEEHWDGVLELEEMRLSSPIDDVYSQFTKRSEAFLQYLDTRQSQLTRAVSFSHARQSRHGIGHETEGNAEQPGVSYCDSGYEDITIDWRQALPSESMDMTDDEAAAASGRDSAGKKIEETARSSLSFTSSWAPPSLEEARRLSGHPNSSYAPDSPWYGFSPITPEFHRNSQLPGGGMKAIDALLAGSVRRRIMTDQSSSFEKLDTSCTSLNRSMQLVNPGNSSSGLSSNSSQETTSTSSFQFARTSYASAYAIEMEPMPLDNFMCQTSSPVEQSPYSEDLICQTASPIDVVYSVACSMDCSVACSIDCSVDCSADCSVNASDDDEVEYASPIMGDYLPLVKGSSPCARAEKFSTDLSVDESNMGARALRRSSMSRTLEELMRHNFTL